MNDDRRVRLWGLVVHHSGGVPVAMEHVAAIVVAHETIYASDPVASRLEELALTLGEGPGIDAWADGAVLAADLTAPRFLARWPAFAPAAVELGVSALFALPLRIGGMRLGVLSLHRGAPGELERARLADVLVLADAACAVILDTPIDDFGFPMVHQATGMLIEQLGVSASVALARLRAHAYANDRPLREVAADVVARRLRFHRDG